MMESSKKNTNDLQLSLLPEEIRQKIFSNLSLEELVNARVISKQDKESADEIMRIITEPKYVMNLIDKMNALEVQKFLDFYRKTPAYQSLEKKSLGEMQPEEIICYLFTVETQNQEKYGGIDFKKLKLNIKKEKLSKQTQYNLDIILLSLEGEYDELGELLMSGSSLLSKRSGYLNLGGGDLTGLTLKALDLSSASLRKIRLHGTNLEGANLSNANLSNAVLLRSKLQKVNLSNANLSAANLAEAELEGANLQDANLSGANLCNANLSGADLSGATLSGVILERAILAHATLNTPIYPKINSKGVVLLGGMTLLDNADFNNFTAALDSVNKIFKLFPEKHLNELQKNLAKEIVSRLNKIELPNGKKIKLLEMAISHFFEHGKNKNTKEKPNTGNFFKPKKDILAAATEGEKILRVRKKELTNEEKKEKKSKYKK